MGSPMTGPISEAATGPREPAAAVPAKEGLPPGLSPAVIRLKPLES